MKYHGYTIVKSLIMSFSVHALGQFRGCMYGLGGCICLLHNLHIHNRFVYTQGLCMYNINNIHKCVSGHVKLLVCVYTIITTGVSGANIAIFIHWWNV